MGEDSSSVHVYFVIWFTYTAFHSRLELWSKKLQKGFIHVDVCEVGYKINLQWGIMRRSEETLPEVLNQYFSVI
jgi:hypothetical protein